MQNRICKMLIFKKLTLKISLIFIKSLHVIFCKFSAHLKKSKLMQFT